MALKKKELKNRSTLVFMDHKKTLHKNLNFTATEQYKLLRTNLSFILPEDEKCPVIGVTSAMRGEGKSTTAVNLSYVLAESGKKVLLIDGDLRIPSVAKKLGMRNTLGLTDLLRGVENQQIGQFKSEILDNWYIFPTGTLPPNPSELLGSRRMEKLLNVLKENFDYIIIDLPPVNLVSDAVTISHLITGMILVVREGFTEKRELELCSRQLKLSNVNVLGCVINDYSSGKPMYGKYKKYYKYYKYYENPALYSKKDENPEE